MRRVLIVSVVAALLVGGVSTAVAAKGEPPAKAEICHVNGGSDITYGRGNPSRQWAWGVLISVSEKSLAAHEAHGDNLFAHTGTLGRGDNGYYTQETHPVGWDNLHWAAANRDGLYISPGATCFFEVFP